MATVTTTEIQQIYIGYLGRAADKAGLDYWVEQISSDKLTLEQLRANITNEQAEYKDGYGQLSRSELVDQVYQTLFERAPDAAGKEYWVNGDGKDVNADQLIKAFLDGASTADQAILDNKTDVAEYYTAAAGANYDKTAATNTIGDVTADAATVAAAKQTVDTTLKTDITFTLTSDVTSVTEGNAVTFTVTASDSLSTDSTFNYQIGGVAVAGGTADPAADLGKVTGEITIPAGQKTATFTVTPTDDGVTEGFEGFNVTLLDDKFATKATSGNVAIKDGAAAGQTFTLTANTDSLQGTSGNDNFNGVVQAAGADGTTTAPGDVIDGGAGEDTLTVSVAGALGADYTLSAVSTQNVEKVLLSNFDTHTTNSNTVDTSLMNGLTTVGLSASSATGDTTFSNLKNLVNAEMNNGAADLTLGFNANVVAGTADAIDLTVSNTSGGTFTAAGVETVNVKTGLVDSKLTELAVNDATKVTVSGATDLEVTNGLATKTIDASALTGDLTLTLGNQNQTVTGGAGNDTIDASTFLNKSDTLDGGAGTDTLKISVGNDTIDATASTGELINVSNFEVLQVNSTHDNAKLDMDGVTGVTAVESDSGNNDVEFANLAAGTAINVYSAKDVTANLKDASGDADALTVNLVTTAANKGTDQTVAAFSTSNIETLNLSSAGLNDGKKNTLTTLTADAKLTTLNITGDSDLDLSGTITASKLATVNAADFTGDLSIDGVASVDQTITTGAGNDTIVMGANLTAADVIDGGANTALTDGTAGKDKVTVSAAVGTITQSAALQIANVENIEIANGNASSYIDAAKITGAESLAFSQQTGNTTKVTNLAAGTEIGLGLGTDEFAGTLDVALADASGDADAITLNYGDAIDDNATVVLKVADTVETLNISATKEAASDDIQTITATDLKVKNIVITDGHSGDEIDLSTLASTTTNVDASAYKGKLDLNSATGVAMTVSANGAVANEIDLSTGADTVTLSGKLGTTINNIDGGTGAATDVLNATVDNAATDLSQITNFETLNLTVDNGAAARVQAAGDAGLNAATTVNVLGGNSLSSFTVDVVDDAKKTIDASAFNGAVDLKLASSAFDDDMNIKGGAATTDSVSVIAEAATQKVNSMTGVETLKVTSLENSATGNEKLDLTNVTGLKNVEVTYDNDSNNDTVSIAALASDVAVKAITTEDNDQLVIDLKDKANADNVLNVEVSATTADDTLNLDATGVETLNITNKGNAVGIDLAGVDATGSGSNKVTVAGTGAVNLEALNTDTTEVDASTATGALTIAAAARDADVLTVKGGFGGDAIAMENKADVLDGAAGTDTLSVNYNAILSGIEVDLSAADQIVSMDNSANTAVQSNFENIDLSGYTSASFGAVVTGSTGDNQITGTTNADNINAGAGNDVVTNAGGADTIALGAGDDQINSTAAQAAVNGVNVTGGAGTDTLNITDVGAIDLSGKTYSGMEALTVAADAGADTVTIDQGFFSSGAATLTLTGAADGDNDIFLVKAGATAWDVGGAEANAAAVDAAGEYHLGTAGTDGVLTYFNQSTNAVTTVTIVGLDAGAVALNGGDLQFTA